MATYNKFTAPSYNSSVIEDATYNDILNPKRKINKSSFIDMFKIHYFSCKDKDEFFRDVNTLHLPFHDFEAALAFLLKKHKMEELSEKFLLKVGGRDSLVKFIELKTGKISKNRLIDLVNSFDNDVDRFVAFYFIKKRIAEFDKKNEITKHELAKTIYEFCGQKPIFNTVWFRKNHIKRMLYKLFFFTLNSKTVNFWIDDTTKLASTFGHITLSVDSKTGIKLFERVWKTGIDVEIEFKKKSLDIELCEYLIEFMKNTPNYKKVRHNCGVISDRLIKYQHFIDTDAYDMLTLKLAVLSPGAANSLAAAAPDKSFTYKSYKKL